MEVEGTIKKVEDVQNISPSFKKRGVVVTTQEQYPQDIYIEFVQDKTSLLDSYSPGDVVSVSINLRGREWTSPQGEVKYFNTISGWRIEKKGGNTGGDMMEAAAMPPMPPMQEEDDDLPF